MREEAGVVEERGVRLEGTRVLIVGLGRSGLAACRLAAARGAKVLVVDQRPVTELGGAPAEARSLGAEVRGGGHPPDLAAAADLVVVSPGVPSSVDLLVEARRRGLPVWGEVELASRLCRGRIVGITGSNGKSTTTAMAGVILRAAGVPGGTGGNLGTPLADLLAYDSPEAVHAVELSSFQLETVEAFRATVSVVLNLSPDHMDRHGSLEAYARAKARLLETQTPEDAAVLNLEDPERERFAPYVRGRLHEFSTRGEPDLGAFVREGRIVLRVEEGEEAILPVERLAVRGEHNAANALAAALACRLVGCSAEGIARGLEAFRPLPHRLEPAGTLRGVAFYNDSKATNLDATARALAAFEPGTVHLILGGKDKGAEWGSLVPLLRRHARRVLLVGQAAPTIRKALEGAVPLEDCGTVPRAVEAGFEGASAGQIVLLAPGCASFDQYRNFEERGEDFRRAVRRLAAGEGEGA